MIMFGTKEGVGRRVHDVLDLWPKRRSTLERERMVLTNI